MAPLFLFMFTMSDLLDSRTDSGDNGVVEGRILQMRFRFYCHVQLVTDQFNGLFANFYAPLHAILVTFMISCVYGTVQSDGMILVIVQAYLGFWMLLAYSFVINGYAEVNCSSKNFLWWFQGQRVAGRNSAISFAGRRQIENRDHEKIFKRELRSLNLKELCIRGGSSMFYFDKQLVLTVLEIVLTQSVNLLIMY